MKKKINSVINLLAEIRPEDLDDCSIEDLTQLQYWLSKHQGSVFVKTVGRLAVIIEQKQTV